MLQNLENFESMLPGSQIESLRTTAGLYHPVEKESIYIYIYIYISLHFTRKMDGENARRCAKKTQNPEITWIRDHTLQLMHINRLVQS